MYKRQEVDISALMLDMIAYETTNTSERFLQWITPEGKIAGFLRLSLPYEDYLLAHAIEPVSYTHLEAAHALKDASTGYDEFYLSVYPSSQPVFVDLDRKGLLADLMDAGAIVRTAFCGPCFGAGDTPAHNEMCIRDRK